MVRILFDARLDELRRRVVPPRRTDRGSQFVEFAIYLPAFMMFVVVCFEAFMGFSALERMENAAKTSADAATRYGPDHGQDVAMEVLPGWLSDQAEVNISSVEHGYATQITVNFPLMYENTGLDFPVSRTVEMPT